MLFIAWIKRLFLARQTLLLPIEVISMILLLALQWDFLHLIIPARWFRVELFNKALVISGFRYHLRGGNAHSMAAAEWNLILLIFYHHRMLAVLLFLFPLMWLHGSLVFFILLGECIWRLFILSMMLTLKYFEFLVDRIVVLDLFDDSPNFSTFSFVISGRNSSLHWVSGMFLLLVVDTSVGWHELELFSAAGPG